MIMLNFNSVLFFSILASAFGDELGDFDKMMAPRDKSKWIDPFDMGLDSVLKEDCSATEDKLRAMEDQKTECEEKVKELLSNKAVTEKPASNTSTSKERKTPNPIPADVFLKRYVNHLLSKLDLNGPVDNFGSHLKLEIQLSASQVRTLQIYSQNSDKVPPTDIDHILSSYIKNVETFQASPMLETFKEHISSARDPLTVMVLLLCLVYIGITVLRSLPPTYSALLILILSVSWHWLHLFKKAWAGKHAKLLKSTEVPPECRPHEMTWWQSIQSSGRAVFSSVDKCEEYHKNIMVDPIYEVNPMVALVDLVTSLILHPLSSLGQNVGFMFSGLLEAVPFFWRPVILILFVLLVMFVLILLSGYRIRLPFFLGEIGPARNEAANSSSSLEMREILKKLEQQNQIQIEQNRKMSAPLTLLEYKGQSVQEIEQLPAETIVIRTPSKQLGARKRLLVKSQSQIEDLSSMQKVKGVKSVEENNYDEDLMTCDIHETDSLPSGHDLASEVKALIGEDPTRCANERLPITPVKKMVVEGLEEGSPLDTKFQWVAVEKEECLPITEDLPSHSDEFLKEVQQVFEEKK